MIQTVLLFMLVVGGASVVLANGSAFHPARLLAGPGTDLRLTYPHLFALCGGALVLLWIAGAIDASRRRAQIRGLDDRLLVWHQELLHMQSVARDGVSPALAAVQARTDSLARDARKLRARIEGRQMGRGGDPEDAPEGKETARNAADPATARRIDARLIRQIFPPPWIRPGAAEPDR